MSNGLRHVQAFSQKVLSIFIEFNSEVPTNLEYVLSDCMYNIFSSLFQSIGRIAHNEIAIAFFL